MYTDQERAEYRAANKLVLMSFVNYCAANPDQRFWQALANWSGHQIFAVGIADTSDNLLNLVKKLRDTWEWKGHRG